MIANLTPEQTASIQSLMKDKRFESFLKWLADSREMTHQMMYTTVDTGPVAFLQGEAKALFDVVNKCHEASNAAWEPASSRELEPPCV
jgi:hypothetical protein